MNMTKHNQSKKRCRSALDRIERKCDRILAELLILRRHMAHKPGVDAVIERLHRTARRMRAQAEKERQFVRNMFNSKLSER